MPQLPDRLTRLLNSIVSGARHIIPRATPAPKVDETKVASLVQKYEAVFKQRVAGYARQLANDEMTPSEYRARFLVELRYLLITAAAIGAGGIGNLRREDLAVVDTKLKEQASYLDAWIADIERKPKESRSEGQMAHRAGLYAGSGGALAHEMLHASRYRGFPPLPYKPKVKTLCKNGCKCHWEYANVDREKGNMTLIWTMYAPAEHCATCLKRARYGPIYIKNFQYVNLPPNLQDYFD